MGFALWIEPELAWAEGRHEYRPMGVAVVSSSDVFRQRDFRPARPAPPESCRTYVGLFASLGEVNAYLERGRVPQPQSQAGEKNLEGQ